MARLLSLAVSPDGRRIVYVGQSERVQRGQHDPPVTHIEVVLNWLAELKARASERQARIDVTPPTRRGHPHHTADAVNTRGTR